MATEPLGGRSAGSSRCVFLRCVVKNDKYHLCFPGKIYTWNVFRRCIPVKDMLK